MKIINNTSMAFHFYIYNWSDRLQAASLYDGDLDANGGNYEKDPVSNDNGWYTVVIKREVTGARVVSAAAAGKKHAIFTYNMGGSGDAESWALVAS